MWFRRRRTCDIGMHLHHKQPVLIGHCYTHKVDFLMKNGCPRG